MRKIFAGLMLLLLLMGCAALESLQVREERYGKSIPVISHSFASKELRPGETWKVYLKASDPDGDMKNIVSIIEQPGVGQYPVSLLRIKGGNQKELSGFIYLNTAGSQGLDFVNITLSVVIEDKAGHFSKPAVFPLAFNSRSLQENPPEGVYPNQDLGPIMISLRSMNDGAKGGVFDGN